MTIVNRLEILDEKIKTESVIFHKFMLKYPRNNTFPFCMVEGEDDEKYYSLRVKLTCSNNDPIFIPCNGKKGVLETYNLIKRHEKYNNGKILFFIDRDFDDLVDEDSIYETPYYSIENFYTTDDSIVKICRSVFNIDESEDDYKTFFTIFKERQLEFHEATKLLNAWLICQRDLHRQGVMPRLDLRSFKLREFLSIKLDSVEMNYDLAKIEDKFSGAYKINQETIDEKLHSLRACSPQEVFRGKFELEFLCKMLELLQTDICNRTPQFFQKRRRVSLNLYDAIAQFSSFAYTPQSLINYITLVWQKEISIAN